MPKKDDARVAKIPVELSAGDIAILTSALDSHRYWQLSDTQYRNDGFVTEPGSDDEEAARDIEDCDELEAILDAHAKKLEEREKLGAKLAKAKPRKR